MKREHQPLIRSYKTSFDPDSHCENPSYPKRENLTLKQKNWLRRAWSWASVSILEMDHACIPNAVPCYNEKKGWHFTPAIDTEWNHIEGVGESMHFDGSNAYNRPENLVPLSRINHTGGGFIVNEDGEEVEIFVVHKDQTNARQSYGEWKKTGLGPDPYKRLFKDRELIERQGISTHDASYDDFFKDLAERVVSAYRYAHSYDQFPK